jgi:hypothetical protein
MKCKNTNWRREKEESTIVTNYINIFVAYLILPPKYWLQKWRLCYTYKRTMQIRLRYNNSHHCQS